MKHSYSYYHPTRLKTVCSIKYKGRDVRGVAICDASDCYDEETGKTLSRLRAELRLKKLRMTDLEKARKRRYVEMKDAMRRYERACEALDNGFIELMQSDSSLRDLEKSLQ